MRAYFLAALLVLPGAVGACASDLDEVEGYTVISVTQVDGEFEGCDFDKIIKLMDGSALKCSSYGYQYAYMPDAVVFGKRLTHEGRSFVSIKLLVEDEIYDMSPELLD